MRASVTPTRSTAPSAATSRKSGRLWHYEKIRRSISTAAIKDGLIYLADFSGFLHCLDQKTGKPYWVHDMFAAIWGSPMIIDDKVYLGDEDGDITVLQHGKEMKVVSEQNMGSSVYSTVVPANGDAVRDEPQSALCAGRGRVVQAAERSVAWDARSTASMRRRDFIASWLAGLIAAARSLCAGASRAQARRPPMRGRTFAATPRSPASRPRRFRVAQATLGLGGRPGHPGRFVTGHRRRTSCTSARPPASSSRWV